MKIARLGKRGALSGWKKSVLLHITAIKRVFFCQACSLTIPSSYTRYIQPFNLWKLYRSNLWKLKITSHHLIIFPVVPRLPSLWWHSGHWEPPRMSRLLQPLVLRMRCRHCWARMADHPTFASAGLLVPKFVKRHCSCWGKTTSWGYHFRSFYIDYFGVERYFNMIFPSYQTSEVVISTTATAWSLSRWSCCVAALSPHHRPGEYWASDWLLMYPANSLWWHWWNMVKHNTGMCQGAAESTNRVDSNQVRLCNQVSWFNFFRLIFWGMLNTCSTCFQTAGQSP